MTKLQANVVLQRSTTKEIVATGYTIDYAKAVMILPASFYTGHPHSLHVQLEKFQSLMQLVSGQWAPDAFQDILNAITAFKLPRAARKFVCTGPVP